MFQASVWEDEVQTPGGIPGKATAASLQATVFARLNLLFAFLKDRLKNPE